MISAMLVIHDDERVNVFGIHQVAILPRGEIENEEMGALVRSGTVIGASGDIGNAATFIGSDAADAPVRYWDGIDAGRFGLRIIDHRIATGIVGPFLVLVGIALLGAEINFAAGA